MRRREFLTGIALSGSGATRARAQSADRVARVAVLQSGEVTRERMRYLQRFRERLSALGWQEGRNVVLDVRYAEGRADLLNEFASSVVAARPDVILAMGGVATVRALRERTSTVPVVMVALAVDPIEAGFIDSLSRPGRNITGSLSLGSPLNEKRLEVLKEVAPHARRVGVMLNPKLWRIESLHSAASALGLDLVALEIRDPEDLTNIAQRIRELRLDALAVLTDPVIMESHLLQTIGAVESTRLPAIYPWPSYVTRGGLMSYSANLEDLYGRAALTVDRILKGAHPKEVPVEQPERFELVINLKTAQGLGLTIPPTLLARAEEVIE